MDIHDYIKAPVELHDGIYKVLSKHFLNDLNIFLNRFSEIQKRENHYQLPFNLFEQFPHVDIKELESETFTRKQDLMILQNKFSEYLSKGKTALEIGGWNGWLTNYLATQGLNVVSADIFEDEQNGLKSKNHHKISNWLSVQTDVTQADIYNSKFDLIVFNHCLQFYNEPLTLVERYKTLLNTNGVILILGNTFYKNTSHKENQALTSRKYFKEKYQFDIQFYPCKGYFSYQDFEAFSKNCSKFISYNFSFLGGLKKIVRKEKSGILYYTHS